MYYYMSLCNIPFFISSLEPLHGFASNFVWMFLGWTPTKFVISFYTHTHKKKILCLKENKCNFMSGKEDC